MAWLAVAPPSKLHTLSTVLFHKDGGANFSVTNCMSHFSMFVSTKATLKLANGNMGHAKGIGIFFPSLIFHYISSGTSLIFSRSHFQQHLIRQPQKVCWFSKGYIWTSWTLWLYRASKWFLEITLPDPKQFILYSDQNYHIQPSHRQNYCCPNCLCNSKIKIIYYSSSF